jgi:hypothetical protein
MSVVPPLIAVCPTPEDAEVYVKTSLVAVWYAVLHFSMKPETEEAPVPVKLSAKAEGVIATAAATAKTTAFENVLKRMVYLS